MFLKRVVCLLAVVYLTLVVVDGSTCVIDGATKQQPIDGFGFSSAWCGTLPTAKNVALYETLGMSILRIRIDENQGWTDETNNAKVAHSYGATVMGTAWSGPPKWNSNGAATGGYLLPAHYADYAAYLKKAATSIGLDYVSFQNEPDYGTAWVSWTGEQMHQFVVNFTDVIDTPLIYPESYQFVDSMADPLLNDPNAVDLIDIVGGHIYGAGVTVHKNAIAKGKHVWQTEHYIEGSHDIGVAMQIAQEVSDCMNDQFNAYVWWWVYDYAESISLLNKNGTIYKNGYTLGQFSKYLQPGSQKIDATYTPTNKVVVTAYLDAKGFLVVVAANTGTTSVSQTFSLQSLDDVVELSATRTSATENMSKLSNVLVDDHAFTYTLPAQSITTFFEA